MHKTLQTLAGKQSYQLPLRWYVITLAHVSGMRMRRDYWQARDDAAAKRLALANTGWDWPRVIHCELCADD